MYGLFPLSEELELLRASVSTFAHEKIAPRAAAIDTGNAFPRDLWPRLGVVGLLAITVEQEFGGAGMGYINDSSAGRLLRDAKLYEIGAGTSEIRRRLIGRELFEETTGDHHGRPD